MEIKNKYKVANPTNRVSYKEGTKGWWSNSFEGICYCVDYPKDNTIYECEFVCNGEKDSVIICRNKTLGNFACQYFYPMEDAPQKNWFTDYLELFPKNSQKETCRIVTNEVCKKIMSEVKERSIFDVKYAIESLGIHLE